MAKDDKRIAVPVKADNKAKKPSSFPQKKWDSWNEASRQNYLNVIAHSNKITGKGDK